ncbi:MAG: hypothetical protein US83_C0001G0013 [Candidatus Falkowbacteria bacterium GW2011_GWC2_38_22]|uniref:Uncharacterized protein n=1 Tax=Candidatus Falkowbacteria bacterium GW2011_GWE1_38_31 TaxID=1618638 RepID=A0A0G0MAZ9_9BACT|nr:MAG: hypothetical protein US73_C0004G0115 [Candidatus Falkowbacteria bacterium GW2011_GWF2_38_1205]KKQ62079.1 MAG: hypothetical protein US83_C0001G0013 [Candidatus Falkowbacteria bacterium GW2011_GWC2_38_22]KKQ64229.1 MAG: hypothetical protein US84_C0001G0013 [Candidatus Falkowbacteria bacterium GW2011_GWF1_38_22]KKQ66206.1 MAG: hypothetical protein US87_C0002G0013 [Candidatus Falkowbacteria bacterium GW2011_GWE2_38_254]KKQ70934.1 MAG: hypothetical protein US91_C0002G0013 [Candidatus Falkowb
MAKIEKIKPIFNIIKNTRIYWSPVFVFLFGILFAYFIFPNFKSEPFLPVLAMEGLAAPVYSFPMESIDGREVPCFLITNPGQSADYKWQYRNDGVFALIDRKDEKGWQVLAQDINVIPEYYLNDDKTWKAYERISTSSNFFIKEGDKGEMIIEREFVFRGSTPVATGVEPLNSGSNETLKETWRIPTSPDNQRLKAPKAEFKMSKNTENLWRLKWVFLGLSDITKDNIDIKDKNGWPIRSKKYSDGEFVIDVDDFDNMENDRGVFSFSEYMGRGGIVEIIFFPKGTDGERNIDPVLASTGIGTGWTDSKQRNVFHNGDYFFLLYTDGAGNLHYRTATSSVWSATSTLITDMSVSDPAFDLFAVNDTTIDLAYISNSSANVYVMTCSITDASINCEATSTLFAAATSVSIARTGHNRIWVAGRGTDNTLKIYSADFYGSATSGTTWLGEATTTESNLSGEISLAPYLDNDKIVATYPVNQAGSDDDELKATAITRAGYFTASSTLTNWNSADIDISGLVWISDDDFRLLARDNATATGTAEYLYNGSSWSEVDANIDVDWETDGTNPAFAAVTDQSTTTLYAILIDSGSGDLELYRKTYSGVWGTEVAVNGAESGTRSLPIVSMLDVPARADRPSPRELPFAYRLANGVAYDLYVGSVGLAPKMASADNQVFRNGQANTTISPITISNCSSSTLITAASDIRIRIATSSANMRWDTSDTSATISGSASEKVSATVSYEGVYTLKIDVTSDFAPWESITISDLSLGTFAYANPGNTGALRLYLNGVSDLVDEARDTKAISIYGQLSFSNHTIGQLENQWSTQNATSSTYHFRFKATPTGEDINIGTTTFSLSDVSGVSTADIVSAKLYYDGNGNGASHENDWANSGLFTYNSGASQADYVYAVTIDSQNNIYVTGSQYTNGSDWAIRKYTSTGILDTSWGTSGILTYNSGALQSDIAQAVTIDSQNNVYVAGTQGTNGFDWAIRKYTSAGTLDTSWGSAGQLTYNSGASQWDFANAVILDSQNNIYIVGSRETDNTDWVIRKYTSTGILDTSWGSAGMVTYNSGASQSDDANTIIIDSQNNIYIAGFQGTNGADWAIRKYTSAGILDTDWGFSGLVTYNSGDLQLDYARAIAIDSQNNIYVAGSQQTNGYDWIIRKYTSTGTLDTSWGTSGILTYNSGASQADHARSITLDCQNNIYVAGYQGTNGTDWAIRKYTSTGILDTSWGTSGILTYNSGASQWDYAQAITIDNQNNIYVAGYQSTNGNDWAVRKYDPSGQIDIYRDSFYMPGEVNISGNSGTIVFATTSPYKVTKATDFLVELTVANIAVGDKMTIDYASASSTGERSRLAITPSGDSNALTHRVSAEISSAANQIFALGQATTSIAAITITDRGGVITATNNIRINISTSTSYFLWDTTDTNASISGGASGKVDATVSYEQDGGVLLINVTSDFNSGDTITVSGLSFASFNKIAKLGQGALRLYLDGVSDTSQDGLDDKTIAVTAALTASEHTLAQENNKWSALSTTADGTHYRFRLTSAGETTEMRNALFDFSGITGVVTSDITNAFLYADMNRDGYYGYSIPEAWYLGFDSTTAEMTYAIVVDTANNVVYTGQGNGSAEGDIYYCRPSADGDADGICEGSEFTKSYEGAQELIWSMAIDTRSGAIYAGQGSGSGDGDIYRCAPLREGDSDGLCETGEWTKAYEGSEEYILALAYDNDNSVMYAGQGSGATDGNIYACAPYDYGDKDGLCETGEWYGSFNGDQEGIYSLVYESYYNVMYAGQGSGSGDGDIYYCRPNTDGDADGICEYGEWTKSWEGTQEYVASMAVDTINNVVYFGQGSGSGDGDVYYCRPGTTGNGDGICSGIEWTVVYNSTTWEYAYSIAFDSGQRAIYIGGSSGSGDGDIYRCFANVDGDRNGICETGEWSTLAVFDGGQEYIQSLAVDPVNGVVYAGQGSGSGDGDVYYYSTGDYKIAATGTVAITGANGTVRFATSTPWRLSGAVDYIIQLNGANIASGDALTIDWNSASTTGWSTAGTPVISGNPTGATHRVGARLSTAANQAFDYQGADTAISPITITDVSGIITAVNNIRVSIATTSVNLRWDTTDTSASISGTASGKVSTTVSYADGGATLVIDVTSDFSAGEAITVSDLSFENFNTVTLARTAGLNLYLSGANIWNQDGKNENTIAIRGTAVAGNHALGQLTNTWQALNENMSEFLYRWRVTPAGETINLGTTTLSLPGLSGFSAGDFSDVVIYYDANGNGELTDGAWGDGGSGMINYDSGSSQMDIAVSIVIDQENNIYVAGYQGSNGNDWAIRKYTSAGILDTNWGINGMVTYNSGSSQSDNAYSIVIDQENSIYVAGHQGTDGNDWAIRKYTSAGILDTAWGISGMVTYNSGSNQFDSADSIAIDQGNNIYVAGLQSTNGNDWVIRKYTFAGILDTAWGTSGMVTYNSGLSQIDYTSLIAIDQENNIYVVGYQQTNGYDWAIRKYTSAGILDTAWGTSGMVTYNSGSSQNDYANSIAIDQENNIYVAGRQQTNGYDWAIRKYTSAGILDTTWGTSGMVTYNSGSSQNDYANSIAIDQENNIYVAGRQQTNGYDWAIRKYTSAGILDTAWGTSGMVTYNSGSSLDEASAITIDSQDNIYVAGYQLTNGGDWAIRKYDAYGNFGTYIDGPAASGALVNISNGVGTITLATSSVYGVSQATDFLLKMTLSNVSQAEELKIDFGAMVGAGYTSIEPISITGDPDLSHYYKPEYSIEGNAVFEGTVRFE